MMTQPMTRDEGQQSGSNDESTGAVVTRCVCHDVSFEKVRRFAAGHHGCTLSMLRDEFGCGTGCGLCVPFLRLMLATGRTRFHPDEAAGPQAVS